MQREHSTWCPTCCNRLDRWLDAVAPPSGRVSRSTGAEADEGLAVRCTLPRRAALSSSAESLHVDSCTRYSDARRSADASCSSNDQVSRWP